MKKIINNKQYNTETAKKTGSWDNGKSYTDLLYCSETLYRKATGEYFLHGEGGAMTIYSKSTGNNSRCGAETIIPLTYDAAKNWAKEKMSDAAYEAEFGDIAEDDSKIIISISITKGTAERLKRMASESGTTISAIIENEYKQ